MSGGGDKGAKSAGTRVIQALALAALFGLLLGEKRLMPAGGGGELVAATGFLLLAGTLASELVEMVKLPHLSGYLIAGIVAGPHVLGLIDHHTVGELTTINTLALALIALAGGAELELSMLREGKKGLAWAMFFQTLPILVLMAGVFVLARPIVPFLQTLEGSTVIGVGLLWGALAITRSPSATLGILAQTRASGPLTRFTLAFVMTSDIVVVVIVAVTQMAVRALMEPSASFSMRELSSLGHELLGSVAIGTTLGLLLAAYLRLVGKQLMVVLVALGFGATEVLHYLRFEALLTFMVAGFVVQNLSKQGHKLVKAVSEMSSIVYVVFFATAGAHLDVPLLKQLWPAALLLASARGIFTYVGGRLASKIAGDSAVIQRWGSAGLVSQAGLTLGIAAVIARSFPSFGEPFRALTIATVAVNEMIGPVIFKLALDRNGESSNAPQPSIESLGDERRRSAPEAP